MLSPAPEVAAICCGHLRPHRAGWRRDHSQSYVTDMKLKNGLRVIIVEDHAAPVVSIAVTYNVGSRDERKGRTGFAHLFEHMMFKGSRERWIGRTLHARFQQRRQHERHHQRGSHATISKCCRPTNSISALFLEADRMRTPGDHQRQPRQPAQRSSGRTPPRR